MIGKCKAVGGSSEGIAYLFKDKLDETKERGYELDRNMILGDTPNEILSELKQWNGDNARDLKNEVFSMVFSPAGKDGEKLTDEQLIQLGKEFMTKTLGIDPNTQPYYMRVHDDTKNKHVHIYTPRTDANGQTISDKHCQYKAMNSADQIAEKHGLTRAKEVMENNIEVNKDVKEQIKNNIHQVLSKSTSWDDFKTKASKKGIGIKETINKQGALQGYRIEVGKLSFKASDIDRKITLPKLDQVFKQNVLNIAKDLTRIASRGLSR